MCAVVFPVRLSLIALLCLTGCALPRGAALQSEVLKESREESPDFQVVHVSRSELALVSDWPVTGWSGGYHWIGNGRGPESPLIRAGDLLTIIIWDAQENSLITSSESRATTLSDIQVSPQGTVFVPYVGDIVVNGQTPDTARKQIQDALLPVAPDAQVQLSVSAGKLNSVDLVTGVSKPGSYPLIDRNTTILSLIAQGGGVSSTLRNPLVRLIRDGKTFEIRADRLFKDGAQNTTLRGGDKVLVEEDGRFFTAVGASGKEQLVYFDRDQITAMEALSLTGGLADSRANPKAVLILRSYPAKAVRSAGNGPTHQDVVFVFDLTSADGLFAARAFRVNPGDTVYATESAVVAAQSVLGLIGSVFGLRGQVVND